MRISKTVRVIPKEKEETNLTRFIKLEGEIFNQLIRGELNSPAVHRKELLYEDALYFYINSKYP